MSLEDIGETLKDILGKVGKPKDGRKVVATAGTRVPLADPTPALFVIITGETDNTDFVTVGGERVIGALATREGTPLGAADGAGFFCKDLSDFWLDAVVSGEGVTYTYWPPSGD